jgi:hypothetical protein
MKQILTAIAMLGLTSFGFNLSAQQSPSAAQQEKQVDTQSQTQSFQGKIEKSGDKLVLRDSSTQTAYQLDDQQKAKQYKGQNVKVTATMDPNTNTLHIVEIAPTESK